MGAITISAAPKTMARRAPNLAKRESVGIVLRQASFRVLVVCRGVLTWLSQFVDVSFFNGTNTEPDLRALLPFLVFS